MHRRLRAGVAMAASALLIAVLAMPAAASAFGPISSFGGQGEGAGHLSAPSDISIAPDGRSLIADYSNNRIDVFSPAGEFLFAFGAGVKPGGGDVCTAQSGCQGSSGGPGAGSIESPSDVAVDPATGRIFVDDYGNDRVDVYSGAGAFLYAFGRAVNSTDNSERCTEASGCRAGEGNGGTGDIHQSNGFAVTSQRVYVADGLSNRVDVFTPEGEFLYAFGKGIRSGGGNVCNALQTCVPGTGTAEAGGLYEPYDVAVGAEGNLFVSDRQNQRVDVFTPQGAFLYGFGKQVNFSDGSDVCDALSECQQGSSGSSAGSLGFPGAIAKDPAGNLDLVEWNNNRISEFTPTGAFVRAFGEGVVNGAEAFEICTAASGCVAGKSNALPGSIGNAYGVAVDCRSAVYAVEDGTGISRVERFGEPGTPTPATCTDPTPTPTPTGAPSAPGATPPAARLAIGKLKLNLGKGTGTLFVTVSGPGVVILKGPGLAKVSRRPAGAGTVALPLKPVGRAKRQLLALGRAKVKATVTFTLTGGTAASRSRTLTLRRKL
ncbi:MAG TPA: hypothetical protein VF731_14440 [Solirubrobacterales bacterium]